MTIDPVLEYIGQGITEAYPEIKLEREFMFHPTRKWRADYAITEAKVLIEIEGGAWTKGRHTRGQGFIADMEKYNNAALLGYIVLRFTPTNILTRSALALILGVIDNQFTKGV